MMAFLDTSFVVRYLTGTPEAEASQVAAIIDGVSGLQIDGVALAETAYVLSTLYQMPREDVVDNLIEFLQKSNIQTHGMVKSRVLQGLLMCRPSARVSFADALIWASARSAGADIVYSLDQHFPSDGLEVRQAP
ncbi:MAG: PIN domain-containing protein [Chloroflexi bacterium]|nr:PIN domain-containing protein [Chloroflexota bacterium]